MTAAAIEKPDGSWPWWAVIGGVGLYAFSKYVGEAKKMQEMFKELEETRSSRDAAIATAGHAMTLVASLVAIERLLREKLKAAEGALEKERKASMDMHHKNADIVQNLEKANEHWKQKHADLEARCAQLEVQFKENEAKLRVLVRGGKVKAAAR